ncbi:glutaminyl-peptide cyclotransferase-like [Anopheles moucheti]|uniref:glutaminyl-peptide cyclotransferase-like n=1 Tax=Anopheles moucheti TaxID=186751 RepID=UPI0022F01F3F|nr:glutaminyl-peptide cyclotransferase-like [Anopheles moucheti]
MPRVHIILLLFAIAFLNSNAQHGNLKNVQSHTPSPLSTSGLQQLAAEQLLVVLPQALENLLVERVVGTAGHENVKNYIVEQMKRLGYTVDLDEFEQTVPILGKVRFGNIIASLNPNAERNLVLACHYDSKHFPGQKFIGATDSAVPCAMLITMAAALEPYLQSAKARTDLNLQFIFFDGEEAIQNWSEKDSLYGARHLAEQMERNNTLKKMDMLVLLDLLGTPEPNFYSYFPETENWYVHLLHVERRLDELGHLENYSTSSVSTTQKSIAYFKPHSISAQIEDDHIPFLRRGVPVLHVIPHPFPDVWHRLEDNGDIVDVPTVRNLIRIFSVFVIEYLHVSL